MLMTMVPVVLKLLTKVTIMNRLFSNLARVITSRGSITLPNLVTIVSAVAPHMVVKYRGRMPFIINIFFVFSFLALRTAHTREPISTHNSSKDVV